MLSGSSISSCVAEGFCSADKLLEATGSDLQGPNAFYANAGLQAPLRTATTVMRVYVRYFILVWSKCHGLWPHVACGPLVNLVNRVSDDLHALKTIEQRSPERQKFVRSRFRIV